MLTILFLVIFNVIYVAKSLNNRKEEFSRIKKYELVHFNIDSFDEELNVKIIEFDAFNEHYKIELFENEDMIASDIRHANVDPTSHQNQFFTSLTKSCHYFGHILNIDDNTSRVALSLCNQNGIRGRIVTFNETLIITPSAYYLDIEKDKNCQHNISDEHLIYKLSDFDTTNIGRDGAVSLDPSNHRKIEKQLTKSVNENKRRRLYNNGLSQTEMLIVNGPIRYAYYKSIYGDNWYEQMVKDYADTIHQVSAEYESTNFGAIVGKINVKFVELEVIFAFSGRWASLSPSFYSSSCSSSYSECNINGQGWLSRFYGWISQYKDTRTFDNAQLISNIKFEPGMAGWGNQGAVCLGAHSVSDIYVGWGLPYLTRTLTHELGHNFGMSHDGQGSLENIAGCGNNDGVMGYGSGQGFSHCSISALQTYFQSYGGLTCLGTTPRSFSSNYDDAPTPKPTSTSTNWGCVGIINMNNNVLEGHWTTSGVYGGKTAYTLNGHYLYYHPIYNFLISRVKGSISALAQCAKSDITECDGVFVTVVGTSWQNQASSQVYNCDDLGAQLHFV